MSSISFRKTSFFHRSHIPRPVFLLFFDFFFSLSSPLCTLSSYFSSFFVNTDIFNFPAFLFLLSSFYYFPFLSSILFFATSLCRFFLAFLLFSLARHVSSTPLLCIHLSPYLPGSLSTIHWSYLSVLPSLPAHFLFYLQSFFLCLSVHIFYYVDLSS